MNACFNQDSVEGVHAALRELDSEWSQATLKLMNGCVLCTLSMQQAEFVAQKQENCKFDASNSMKESHIPFVSFAMKEKVDLCADVV